MYTTEQIDQANVKELRAMALALKIKNGSKLNKADLQERILQEISEPVNQEIEVESPGVFFERVSALTDIKEVKAACESLIQNLKTEHLTAKSKANKLSGYRKLFKTMMPTVETLHLFFEYKPSAEKPAIMRHVFDKFTGLADMTWETTNQSSGNKAPVKDEVTEALSEENKVYSLERYLESARKLLNSENCWEMGVGLLAVSGRRPSDLVVFSEFSKPESVPTYIPYPEYAVHVKGFAKKRGKTCESVVPLLIPCNEFLQVFKNFRLHSELKPYLKTFEQLLEIGYDQSDAWKTVESSLGIKLRNVTDAYFDFLPKIDEGENRKNILLRACAPKLITLRDKPKVTNKSRLIYAGIIQGHIVPQVLEDGTIKYDGKVSSSTHHYDDYDPDTVNIPLLKGFVKISQTKLENENMVRIAELESKIAELTAIIQSKDEEIEQLQSRLKAGKKAPSESLGELSMIEPSRLFKVRGKGTPVEKLNRAYRAIKDYNEHNPEQRVILTNGLLRDLTGCNGNDVSAWMTDHKDEWVSYFSKFEGMTKEDGSLNMFYNRTCHKGLIQEIVENIKNNYLLRDLSL